MTNKDLIALMGCEKKYRLRLLSLKGQDEKKMCFRKAIQYCIKGVAENKGKESILNEIRQYLETAYQKDWFTFTWQKSKTIESDMGLFCRLMESFPFKKEIAEKGSSVAAFYPISVDMLLDCNDVKINRITGTVDLLLKQGNGDVTGIVFCRKYIKPYSFRARKEENKVMSSMELLVMLKGLKELFPGNPVRVMLVQLCSPADRNGMLAEFEQKRGDNIIQFTEEEFLASHPEGVEEHIRNLLSVIQPDKCNECFYNALCRSGNKMFIKEADMPQKEKPKKYHFSDTQKEIIEHEKGPLRVCAGPGSGKTAVLVERVKALIEKGVRPERILMITFTKKAAQEMAQRIDMEAGPVVSTLHALAFRILTEHEYLVGTVRLAGTVDCKRLLLQVLEKAPVLSGVSYDGITMRYGLITTLLKDFDFIEKNGEEKYRSTYAKKDVDGILEIKKIYDVAFREKGYITFDEQVTKAVKLLSEHPGILDVIQHSFDYVMVDEVQDLDEPQAEFVRLLVKKPENNIVICGDADQSIYSFRGGSNQFMLDFPEIYKGAEDKWLEENYRSSKEIVEIADALISKNEKRVPVKPRATYQTGFQAIQIPNFNDSRLYNLILEIRQKGYAYQDIAVIARTNKELLKLCDVSDAEAAKSGLVIPMERPKFYLKDDFIFRTVLDLMELSIKGMGQDAPLYRLLTGMGCSITKENRQECLYKDHLDRGLIYDFEGEEASRYYLPGTDALLTAYGKIYVALQKLQLPVSQALEALCTGFFPEKYCTEEVFEELGEIIYKKKVKNLNQLYEIMGAMVYFEDDQRIYYESGDKDRVHMITAHDAKGKEFPVVIVYDVEEFERGDVEEDRRLLYVAVTRAKRVLFLLESYPGKSRFLKEMGDYIAVNRRERYEK